MNRFDLTYRQTPQERYRSEMNEQVEDLIDAYPGIRLVAVAGGSMLTNEESYDQMVADNTLTVEGRQVDVHSLASAIQRQIGRTVEIDPI